MSEKSGHNAEGSPSAGPEMTRHDPSQETFVAKVRVGEVPRQGVFTVTGGEDAGRVLTIPVANVVTLGRAPDSSIRFDDGNLSRLHAHIMRIAGDYVFSDAKSKNGSYVNDVRVTEAVALRDGDRVRLGSEVRLRFALVDEAEERALRDMYLARKRGSLVAAFERLDPRDDGLLEDLLQAREFQTRTLAQPPNIPGVDIEVHYRPVDMVGGDLYQVSSLGDDGLRVFVADATGHGVKASLTTVLIMSEYEFVKNDPRGPAAVLEALNQRLATTFGHLSVQFTAALLDFDLRAGVLRHASAAHPAPVLMRDGALSELEDGGTFMGLVPDVSFPEWTVPIRRGDAVVTFTDGATESFSLDGSPFGDARLHEVLVAASAANAPLGASVMDAVVTFSGQPTLSDDLTIVSVRWLG
jgi:serine phosphatase RsbU (regulator of sigma subunit)